MHANCWEKKLREEQGDSMGQAARIYEMELKLQPNRRSRDRHRMRNMVVIFNFFSCSEEKLKIYQSEAHACPPVMDSLYSRDVLLESVPECNAFQDCIKGTNGNERSNENFNEQNEPITPLVSLYNSILRYNTILWKTTSVNVLL